MNVVLLVSDQSCIAFYPVGFSYDSVSMGPDTATNYSGCHAPPEDLDFTHLCTFEVGLLVVG